MAARTTEPPPPHTTEANGIDKEYLAPQRQPVAMAAVAAPAETVKPAASSGAVADQRDVSVATLDLPPDSELVLVETRFAAPAAEDEEAATQRPRRARPPRQVVPDEPLQMIETHKQDSA